MLFKPDPKQMEIVHTQFIEAAQERNSDYMEKIIEAQRLTRLAIYEIANNITGGAGDIVKHWYGCNIIMENRI